MYLDGVLKFLHEFFEMKRIDNLFNVIVEIVVNDKKKREKEEEEIVSFENFSFFTE